MLKWLEQSGPNEFASLKKKKIPIHVMFQVRIQKVVETPSSPPAEDPESDAATEPAEQDELLDCVTTVEQSDWLWTS